MTTGQRMKDRRKAIGLSAERVAEILGVSPATIYRYENGDIEKVPGDRLEPIAKALQTTPAYLMGWESTSEENYRGNALPAAKNIIPMPQMRKVPLIGSIACGEPILAEEHIEGYVGVPDNIRSDFALLCKGDSMVNAGIQNGDVVYIRKQETVENGQIAAVIVEGMETEATLKRFYFEDNMVTLLPENNKYSPKVFVGSDIEKVRIVGLAVGYTHIFEWV